MKRWQWVLIGIAALLAALALGGWAAMSLYGSRVLDPHFYDDAIAEIEAADRADPPAANSVVFIGSSSIRFWNTLAEDMAPLPVVNRGFGGSQMIHLATNAQRLARLTPPNSPAALVVYAGDNDLAAGTGKTAETVLRDFRDFLEIVRADLGPVPVYFIAIKPSILRWQRWPEILRANAALRAMAAGDPTLHYLDIASPMLGEDGRPNPDLFVFDGLHMSAEGYAVWTEVIRPVLLSDLLPGSFKVTDRDRSVTGER